VSFQKTHQDDIRWPLVVLLPRTVPMRLQPVTLYGTITLIIHVTRYEGESYEQAYQIRARAGFCDGHDPLGALQHRFG
jgi:hypothetical protein